MGDPDIDFAIVTIAGRHPETGRAMNMRGKEIVHIHESHGHVEVEGQRHSLKAGDVVLIEAGESFCW